MKAVVPSGVLRSCLDDMIPDKFTGNPFADDDSDEDDEGGKSKKKAAKKSESSSKPVEQYGHGCIRLKEGRNVNNNLYYVDHTKLSNEGNGLRPEIRNELLCDMQKGTADVDQLTQQLKSITAEAMKLESEPKNEALVLEVADLEKRQTEIDASVEEARAHSASKYTYLYLISVSF